MKLSEKLAALDLHPEFGPDGKVDGTYLKARPIEVAKILHEAAELARRVEGAAVGVIDRIGDDESGQPRVTVHSTREELANGNARPFQRVALVPLEDDL